MYVEQLRGGDVCKTSHMHMGTILALFTEKIGGNQITSVNSLDTVATAAT